MEQAGRWLGPGLLWFALLSLQTLAEGPSLPALKRAGPQRRMEREPMDDEEFLDLVQRRAILYFWHEADPRTGLVKDRARNFGPDNHHIGNFAATGFGLTAIAIAERRGWLPRDEVYQRVLTTLKFVRDGLYHKEGFFYHWLDVRTGKRAWNSEISSVDTALFLAGALFISQYYKDTEAGRIAEALYRRTNWQWMTNGRKFVCHGWRPETESFLKSYWGSYCETVLVDALAIGSPTHPIDPAAWRDMRRNWRAYHGVRCIALPPLFTHQYHNLWIDFRSKTDGIANYFENARTATLINRQYCIDRMDVHQTYGPDCWGLTACDGPQGYHVYGAPPGRADDDGTVAPTAPGGSFAFTPRESLSALRYMYYTYKPRIWGKYGFCDAFNVEKNWTATDVIGIDQGAIVLAIENHRTGIVWRRVMNSPPIQTALNRMGFRPLPDGK
ncbi:MAG: hypothetical protein GXP25_17905 [Planctomycetes bacterium]|nr:hypothetical protein [Planctomycetota bacterium]